MHRHFIFIVVAIVLSSFLSPLRAALGPENLLLVVNKNVPDSQKLAEHYAEARHVPDGRIVALDLPTGENISTDDYEKDIATPVRQFIIDHQLDKQVTCLVTFYGVPLRVQARPNDNALKFELVAIRVQLRDAIKQASPLVEAEEKLATATDASYHSPPVSSASSDEALGRRAEFAAQFILQHLQAMPAGAPRDDLETQAKALSAKFRGTVTIPEPPPPWPATRPATPPTSAPTTPQQFEQRMTELSMRRWDPNARREMRELARRGGGILLFMRMCAAQEQYLLPDDTESAVDNELALVGQGFYSHVRWQLNPLCYRFADLRGAGRAVMVMRLDAAKPEQVRNMIDTSIKVEGEGLTGRIVLDSRGLSPDKPDGSPDMYGQYDQTIRNLEVLLHTRTKLPMLVDDRPDLIPPHTVQDAAVYWGWYSPAKYIPSVAFNPGAVAVHIASYELTALHDPTTPDWCKNLIDAGAVATLGPVSEPYLQSFPGADEFVPVLMTGKLTLAEVYWSTTPMTSWRIAMIGDPLYMPFKKNPALKPEELPPRLRGIFGTPAGLPYSSPPGR